MKNVKQIFKLVLILAVVFLKLSCGKDEVGLSKENLNLKSQNNQGRIINAYTSTDTRHGVVAMTLSIYFKDAEVRFEFDKYCRQKGSSVLLLADFLYNVVLEKPTLINTYDATANLITGSLPLCSLLNNYLADFPGLELSFMEESESEYPSILSVTDFEVVSVYSDIDLYPIYKNGALIGEYKVTDEPTDKIILKLKMLDVFDVLNQNDVTQQNISFKYADLVQCQSLENYLNGINMELISSKLRKGCVINNPLGLTRVVILDSIFDHFNRNCGIPEGFPLTGDNTINPRSTCPRDAIRNGEEEIFDVRGLNGKTIFRDCDVWCSYWDRDCVFQVNVFIPTIASATEFTVLGSIVRVFSLNEKRLRKGWNTFRRIPVTEWLYLEGRHGNEWQYTWTGRHRNRGTESETNVSIGFSSKVGFKIDTITVELGRSLNFSHKVKRANKDCDLGVDIARYCRSIPDLRNLGDIGYRITEKN